ncbi:hypothetical protein CSQ94_01195 [Janthinobacterium sp. BJB312]|nr:hypothetical protein CSQ94_01195 [Janthinobacterium sp. BJB312]
MTIPRRQIGRRQWQNFIEVGEAAIGVEAEGITKHTISLSTGFVHIWCQHIGKIKRSTKFNCQGICTILTTKLYTFMQYL